jgi:hypothetical protein
MARYAKAEESDMIARNSAGDALSAGFISALQGTTETPAIIFRFATDSTADTNEALDAVETVIDVTDNSVFSNGDIIIVEDEHMLISNASYGVNQIEVTRGYWISVAATHSTGRDIYLFDSYPVLGVSDISVDNNLGESEAVVHVSNADQSWNIFLSDPTNHGNLARIELTISPIADNMTLFTGAVDHVEYSDRDMSCYIYLRDRLAKTLDQQMGSSFSNVDYTAVAQNAADIAWDILTTLASLDDTSTQDNIDIDYTKWDAWKTKLTAQNMDDMKGYFVGGSTYRSAIQQILYVTSSWGFITNEGKLGFDYADNDAVAGDDTWTQAHILTEVGGSRVDGNRPVTDLENLVNYQYVSYGHDPILGTWQSEIDGTPVLNQDLTSQDEYGISAIAEANPNFWHHDSASATGGSDWVESIHSTPKIYTELMTWMYGFRTEIGDVIDLTDADYGWTNKLMKVERIQSLNMTNFTLTLLLRA